MLAETPIGFWAFWLGVGLVLYVALVWTMIRLAVRWDHRHLGQTPSQGHHLTKPPTDETEGNSA